MEKNTLRYSSLYILLVLVGAGGLFFSQKKRRFVERETSKAEALVRAARRELETFSMYHQIYSVWSIWTDISER